MVKSRGGHAGDRAEITCYAIAGRILYFVADWLVDQTERYRGARFAQHQVLFFVIILILLLVTFELMQRLLKP